LREEALRDWAEWDLEHGIVERPIDLDAAFDLGAGARSTR
jgi:hypothetical protein